MVMKPSLYESVIDLITNTPGTGYVSSCWHLFNLTLHRQLELLQYQIASALTKGAEMQVFVIGIKKNLKKIPPKIHS